MARVLKARDFFFSLLEISFKLHYSLNYTSGVLDYFNIITTIIVVSGKKGGNLYFPDTAQVTGFFGFHASARAPPIIPSIKPMMNPPPMTMLIIENMRMITPQAVFWEGLR
jgi:hypothetical protein